MMPLYGQGSGESLATAEGAGEDTSQLRQGGFSTVAGDVGE